MTMEQRTMMRNVTNGVLASRVELRQAYDMLVDAANACRGDPMYDRLESWASDLDDLIYDLKAVLHKWQKTRQSGNVPDSRDGGF